jgi:hypothetical protein
MKKLLVIVERYGLFVLVALTILAFGLAVAELLRRGGTQGQEVLLWDAILETITSDSDKAEGWAKRMHMMVTLVLGWAAVRLYAASVGLKWDTFVASRLSRQHVIIVAGRAAEPFGSEDSYSKGRTGPGLAVDKSALAVDLALSLAAARESVVLSLPAVDEGNRAKLWEAGVTVLSEDLAMPEVLQAAGASRARMLIAMRDAYGDNIVLTRAAVSSSAGNPKLECKCMLEPLDAKRGFKLADYFELSTLARIRIFNESEMIARRLLHDHPPDAAVAMSDRRVHVLLVGLGSVGQSVMLQLARMGHYRSRKKPKVTVVDRNVKARWRQVQEAHPALKDWLTVETEEIRVEDVGEAELEKWMQDEYPPTMVYVCTKNEIANLRIARVLLKDLVEKQQSGADTVADVVALDPAGGCVLTDFSEHGSHGGRFHLFSLVRADGGSPGSPLAGGLLSDVDDRVAKQLHEDYCAEDDQACSREPGRQKSAANAPWLEVAETYRDANRSAADHFEVKLRAVGCKLVPADAAQVAAQWSDEEMDLLARMEHDRWWADRALDGWTFAPVRDNRRKHHPNMVAYEELSEEVKKKDKDQIRKLTAILRDSGLEVVRAQDGV